MARYPHRIRTRSLMDRTEQLRMWEVASPIAADQCCGADARTGRCGVSQRYDFHRVRGFLPSGIRKGTGAAARPGPHLQRHLPLFPCRQRAASGRIPHSPRSLRPPVSASPNRCHFCWRATVYALSSAKVACKRRCTRRPFASTARSI